MQAYYQNKTLWIILVIFLLSVYYYFPFSVDDSYIVGRYAFNFSHHGALAYNIEEPISALTSPLHALSESILYHIFRYDPVVLWKFFSLMSLLASSFLLIQLLETDDQKNIFLIATLLSSPILLWAVGGLETIMLLLLLSLLVYLFLIKNLEENRTLIIFSILLGLIFLTRFDSIVFLSPLILFVFWKNLRNIKNIFLLIFPALLIVASWFIYSYTYYGHLMPTSYFNKVTEFNYNHFATLLRGLFWTGALPLLVYVLFTKENKIFTNKHYVLISGLILFGIYASSMAAVHMMFSFRAGVPYLPIVFLLIVALKKNISNYIIILFILFQTFQIVTTYRYGINFLISEWIEHKIFPKEIKNKHLKQEQSDISMRKYIELMQNFHAQGKLIEEDWKKQNRNRKAIIYSISEGAAAFSAINSYFEGLLVALGSCKKPDYIMNIIFNPAHKLNVLQLEKNKNPFLEFKLDYQIPHYTSSFNRVKYFTVSRFDDLSEQNKKLILKHVAHCKSLEKW